MMVQAFTFESSEFENQVFGSYYLLWFIQDRPFEAIWCTADRNEANQGWG